MNVTKKVWFLFSLSPIAERKIPRSGFRRLATQHLTTDVFGLAMGISQKHDLDDGWERCRLCHYDVKINLRGQSSWKAHWHTSEQFSKEFQH